MIALPEDDVSPGPYFPAGHIVLALYPTTTCFYKALVRAPPSPNAEKKEYMLEFDGDDGKLQKVAANYVLEWPKVK